MCFAKNNTTICHNGSLDDIDDKSKLVVRIIYYSILIYSHKNMLNIKISGLISLLHGF